MNLNQNFNHFLHDSDLELSGTVAVWVSFVALIAAVLFGAR